MRWLECKNNFIIEQNNCIDVLLQPLVYYKHLTEINCLFVRFFLSFFSHIYFSFSIILLLLCNAMFMSTKFFLFYYAHFSFQCILKNILCIQRIECCFIHVKRYIKIISCWLAPIHICSIYSPYYNFYWIWSA